MWYLVVFMVGWNPQPSSMVVIPEKYPTEQACKEAASYWNDKFKCIPAPVAAKPEPLDLRGQICTADGKNCKTVSGPYPDNQNHGIICSIGKLKILGPNTYTCE